MMTISLVKRSQLALVLSVLLAFAPMLFANSGKIAGRVIDKETNEPLPGVNVVVEQTNLGAATNIDGEYVILNMPPGKYTLRASFIGYQTVRVEDLQVSIDRTTQQDFALSSEVLSGEEVVVVAERPLVQKDMTASQKITTSEEIAALPVLTFTGVLTTQAGVNTGPDGAIHIRGGRENEIGYYIDGVAVSNPFFTNTLAINVSNKALQELRVVSGAFNAEYGNAMSGIVNIQIKEGGPKYSGSLSAYTGDYVSNDTKIFPNIDDRDPFARYVFEGTLNGPVPILSRSDRFTFNVSGRFSDNEGYLYGKREHMPSDRADFRNNDNWFIELGGDGKYVPMSPVRDVNLLGKLTYKINPRLKFSTQLLHDQTKSKSYSHAYVYNPDGIYNNKDFNNNFSLKVNHSFSKSFYEAHIFYATTNFRQFVYEDTVDARYVSTTNIRGTPPTTTFVFGGTQMGQVFRESSSFGGKIDFTSQINTRHEVKLGASARQDNLQERNLTILYDNQEYLKPTVVPENQSPSHTFYDKNATFISAYLQDKIEYKEMIINAGVRYDYFDPNSDYFLNLLNPQGERTTAKAKTRVSPRLGVAFPITDRGILHFSYGHFYQLPTLRLMYQANQFGAGLAPTVGYANLKPEKTVNYEFGLQQQLTDVLAIDASVFFKDIRDLLALQSIRYESPIYGPSTYSVWLNKDYGAVKGFTLSMNKRHDPTTLLSATVDYTFQQAQGNDVTSGAFYFSALSGLEEEKKIVPLSWDQQHLLNSTVTISKPGNWGISFIGRVASGWPYTPDIPNANYVPKSNSARKPWQKNLDLRFFKNLNVNRLSFVFFTQVFNVFDTRNERFVFDDTGRAGYTFVNRTSQETEEFKRHYGEPGIHTWEEYQIRSEYYTAPRTVQVGISLEF